MGYTVKGLAEKMGVTPQTVRLWVHSGKVPYHVGPNNRTFFTDEDVKQIIKEPNKHETIWAYYARSSCGNQTAINNQIELLKNAYGNTPTYIINDKASGLNENRKGLNKILDLAHTNQITDIAITTQDRLTRFGYKYIQKYLTDNNVKIHILQGTTEKQPEQELIDDFMALLASFSGRYYHLRNTENQQKLLQQAQNTLNNKTTTPTTI